LTKVKISSDGPTHLQKTLVANLACIEPTAVPRQFPHRDPRMIPDANWFSITPARKHSNSQFKVIPVNVPVVVIAMLALSRRILVFEARETPNFLS
jgi:hypothetical protein